LQRRRYAASSLRQGPSVDSYRNERLRPKEPSTATRYRSSQVNEQDVQMNANTPSTCVRVGVAFGVIAAALIPAAYASAVGLNDTPKPRDAWCCGAYRQTDIENHHWEMGYYALPARSYDVARSTLNERQETAHDPSYPATPIAVAAPELNVSSAAGGLTLLLGALAVIGGRRRVRP
jgi:hypothetical protein